MARFIDRVVLHLQAGDGGHGCSSVHREKFKPLGGPDGGNAYDGSNPQLVIEQAQNLNLSFDHVAVANEQAAHQGSESTGIICPGLAS